MHPTLLVVKRSEAIARIERAARIQAERFGIVPSVVEALTHAGNHPQIRELRKLEGIAELLELALGTKGVTLVTEPTVPAQNVQAEEAAVPLNDAPDLPPPSLVEEKSVKPKRSRK